MNTLEHLIEIPQITPQTTAKECLDVMLDVGCFELPVHVEGSGLSKVILEDCLYDDDLSIENRIEQGFPSILVHEHLMDVMRVLRVSQSATCAVVDKEGNMLGVITKEMVMNKLAHSISVNQPGAILVVEVASYQYSSSELARIVEGENAQILGLWLDNVETSGRIRINVKLNTINAERIVSSLMRFNYEVIAIFGDQDYHDNVDQRFKSLMKYLDL